MVTKSTVPSSSRNTSYIHLHPPWRCEAPPVLVRRLQKASNKAPRASGISARSVRHPMS